MSKIIKENDTIIINPEQNLVASVANSFRSELFSLLEECPQMLTIDLAGIDMVDSSGISVIVATNNSLCKTGGSFKVMNLSKDLYNLFVSMRLNQHIIIEAAVK